MWRSGVAAPCPCLPAAVLVGGLGPQPGLASDIAQGLFVGRAECAHTLLDEAEPRDDPCLGMHEAGSDVDMRPSGIVIQLCLSPSRSSGSSGVASSGSWKRSVTGSPQVAVFDLVSYVGLDAGFNVGIANRLVLQLHRVCDTL